MQLTYNENSPLFNMWNRSLCLSTVMITSWQQSIS